MIANLLDNAIQHNIPNGSVELTTGRVTAASQLSVRNSGPNVPTAEVERLFQPFQQLGHNRTGSREGHGLGLAIAQAIAQAHHANITAHPRSSGGLDIEIRFHSPQNSERRHLTALTAWARQPPVSRACKAADWHERPGSAGATSSPGAMPHPSFTRQSEPLPQPTPIPPERRWPGTCSSPNAGRGGPLHQSSCPGASQALEWRIWRGADTNRAWILRPGLTSARASGLEASFGSWRIGSGRSC